MSRGILNEIGFNEDTINKLLKTGRELRNTPRTGTRLITNEEFWALSFGVELNKDISDKLNQLNILLIDIQNLVYTTNDSDKHFIFNQELSSDTWVINHNLQKRPSVTIVDTGNNEVEGDVNYSSLNQIIITFSSAFSGIAYLN